MTPHPDEFTGTEQAVLLVLMAQARPVPNPRLKDLGPELKKAQRDRLRERGLIDVAPGPPMTLDLTDAGWRLCRSIVGSDVPVGVRGQNKTLYTLMRALSRYLDQADLALADVFAPAGDPVEAPADGGVAPGGPPSDGGDVTDRVRTAYRRLAARPGAWVGLSRLRDAVADVPRPDVDAALLALHRDPAVSLIPEENQKTLTDEDRAAAIRIGNKDVHVMMIEP